MLSALAVSAAFLGSYVTYHLLHGSTRFGGPPAVRVVYLGILLSHTVLAIVNLPLIVLTVVRALKREFEKHRRIALWTWRSWMYVSVTGVVVYLMLYQLWTPIRAPSDLEPQASEAQKEFERAQHLHSRGLDQEALDAYQHSAKLGHLGASCFSAVLADRLGATETGSAAIGSALSSDPDEPSCLALRGRALILEDRPDRALPILERAGSLAPADPFVLATLGFARFRLHDYRGAAQAFDRSIEIDPLPANVYNAGYSRFLYGDYGQARPLLVRALEFRELDSELVQEAKEDLAIIDGVVWTCPMHPDERGGPKDRCSQCGMALEPATRGLPLGP
jgi:tetratricopeptide (TPR) repeat protein